MAIAFDSSGSSSGNSVSSLAVDITSAATGAFCYAFIQIATGESTGVAFTGWQQLIDFDEAASSHGALYRRVKQSGDTTFTVSWVNANGAVVVWSSYTGLNTTVSEEGFRVAAHTTNSAAYTTPNATPQDNTRWSLACAGARSTATTGETWSGSTLTIRSQAVNSVLRCSPALIADSTAAVTASSHNYTFTLSATEAHGTTLIMFLIPAAASTPAYPAAEKIPQAVSRSANW